jgi:asparagine synthase (glutamine-hydrolysing)
MPGIMKFYDEPFADASAIPTFYVARETRRHVTVALNGDGGDENFAGYARYVHGMRSRLLRIPPIPQAPLPRTGIARKFELLATNNEKRFFSLNSAFEGHMDNASLPQSFRTFYAKPKKLLDKWLYTDIKTYLPGDLLTKVDIATMANSLEGRSPLLDHKLMEFTASLDPAWKLQGVNTKVIFKRAMKNIVPKEILTKPKQGFAVPINEWMQGEFHDQASAELLGKSNLLETLPRDRITKMLELQKQGKPYGFRLWNLLMLRQWEKSYCE